MPYRIVAEQALARWRAAQAIVDCTPVDTESWHAACREVAASKAAYDAAVEAARLEHRPEPPPFPGGEGVTDSSSPA